MGIVDKLLSPATPVLLNTLTVSTQLLGTVLDFGVARENGLLATPYGPGWQIGVKNGTSGGAATLTLQLVTDDNLALSSPTILWTGPVWALANTAGIGQSIFLPMPDVANYERFLAFRAVVGTAVFTGGEVNVEYVANKRRWKGYPSVKNT